MTATVLAGVYDSAPLVIAAASLIGATYAVVAGQQAVKQRADEAAATAAAAAADDDTDRARLGFEDRQWILQAARLDNDRLRLENSAMAAQLTRVQHQLGEVLARLHVLEAEAEARDEREQYLREHVDRCEAELAAFRGRMTR